MAKPTFNKLGLKTKINTNSFEWEGQTIEVVDYVPIGKKLEIVTDIINDSIDDNSFRNEGRLQIYLFVHILYNYTNLTFTKTQKENPDKIYDNIMSTGFMNEVLQRIPRDEFEFFKYLVSNQIDEYFRFKSSIKGILSDMSTDYTNLDIEATDIQKKLQDPNNLALLKGIMNELG